MLSDFCRNGKTIEAYCNTCDAFADCKFEYRTHEIGGVSLDNVLCGICQRCQGVAVLGSQAGKRFRETTQSQSKKSCRTTVTIPLEMQDYISHRLSLAGAGSEQKELFFRALLLCCVDREEEIAKKSSRVRHVALTLPSVARLPLSLSDRLGVVFEELKAKSGLGSSSELVRCLIVLSSDELSTELDKNLKTLLYAYA